MELVGQILKKNREKKKLLLSDVSKELNISEEILNNIESSHMQNDIDIVFILGHVRAYCCFLNLNEVELVSKFKNENLPNKNKNFEIKRPNFEKNFFIPNKITSFCLILIIFSSFYFLFIEVDKNERKYAIIPDLPESYVSIVEQANLDYKIANKPIVKSKDENFAKTDIGFNSSSAIASLPKDEDYKPKIVTLKILNDTWVQIRNVDDEILFSQLMNKNDEYSYDLESNYSITSGNAGHIMVFIDQKVRGKIGKKGQVVDSLVLNKDFSN
ncbi:MAG: helix-turn-helix domain-containing protein [Alphaproteobacteria bacterium]